MDVNNFAEVSNIGTEGTPAAGGDNGAKVTEIAAPSTDNTGEGAKGESVAVSQVNTEEANGSVTAPDSSKTAENAAFAAARRRAEAEKEQAVTQIRQEMSQEIDKVISQMNLKNPLTGAPVTNKAEYDAYMKASGDQRKRQFMQKNGITESEYDSLIGQLPEVQEARAERERAKAEQEKTAMEKAKAQLGSDLAAIAAINPEIKSFEDLAKLESYPKIYERVKTQGLTIAEAYVLENRDTLISQSRASGKQAALNAMGEKAHLTSTAKRGEGSISVPRDIAEQYRLMMPGATDAEIQQHYNRYIGNK